MLEILPTSWFSWDFTISQGASPIADFGISWWRERGKLTVQGHTFRVYRENMLNGDFVLESERGILARATKPSALRRSFTVQSGAKTYIWRARSAFRRPFVLLEDDREVGAISTRGAWTRRASARFPGDIPLPVQVFLVWLSVLLWKRDSDAAATS
jgi:hypothetical protein